MLQKLWGDKWGLRRVLFLAVAWVLGMVALTAIIEVTGYEGHPGKPFNRKECMERETWKILDRNPDMLELSEDQISMIARKCVREEFGR